MLNEVLHSVQLFCVNLFILCDNEQVLSFLLPLCFNLLNKILLWYKLLFLARERGECPIHSI